MPRLAAAFFRPILAVPEKQFSFRQWLKEGFSEDEPLGLQRAEPLARNRSDGLKFRDGRTFAARGDNDGFSFARFSYEIGEVCLSLENGCRNHDGNPAN
jgi:hypothetical protein